MKRFEFRLGRVMEWRRGQLDVELAGLARLTAEVQSIEKQLVDVESACTAAGRTLVRQVMVDAQQLAAFEEFRVWSRKEGVRLSQARIECEKKAAEQRGRVMDARRRFRLLERLLEKQKAEWEAGLNREIENLAGELYLAQRNRQSPAAPTAG